MKTSICRANIRPCSAILIACSWEKPRSFHLRKSSVADNAGVADAQRDGPKAAFVLL